MAEKNRWSWDVAGFEPRQQADNPHRPSPPPPVSPLLRRYSISSSASVSPLHSQLSTKLQRLKDKVRIAKEDYLVLKQEAIDLQEYSNAKLDRVTRYLGVLADKSRKLDQAALETEARITPLINEKKRLFNELLTAKGSIKVFCRVRPVFEDEGPSIIEFPDDFTLSIRTDDGNSPLPHKDFQFDRVYGPHVGQADLFSDVQPFVQSALDGYNVTIFAFGQSGSGKTHTMEGSSHDRGLYVRCFEELFDLSNSDATSISRFNFSATVFEIYNEQFRDLLLESRNGLPKVRMGFPESFIELSQAKVDNPLDFLKVLKIAFQNRGTDPLLFKFSHLIVTVHIYFKNLITGENIYSKLSLADLAGSSYSAVEDGDGDHATDLLHVMKSLTALGNVIDAVTAGKDVPYENSMLTKVLADSLGGSSKTLMIVNVCPEVSNLSETISTLEFSCRVRNAVLRLGNHDTNHKWSEFGNDACKGLYEKDKERSDLKQEVIALKQALKEANDQCVLLFNEVEKAWKVSYTLQTDLKSENILLVEKHKIEKDQNAQLRNQVAQLLHTEQEQKVQIQQCDSTIQNLQAKLKTFESQLNEALHMREPVLDSRSGSQPTSKAQVDGTDSSAVIKKLEEELSKRDSLIERLHEENEKLFERLTEKAKSVGTAQVSTPLLKGPADFQARDSARTESNSGGQSIDIAPLTPTDKTEGTRALVKSGEKGKTTAAGEYLTNALCDFDPDQYDSIAAIADGANKLLMLVLAAVIKAGASREHEILAEIRDAVFAFIRKMEPRRVLDTMLVSRVRILYIRSLIARSPELQSIKVPPSERFLAKANTGRSRSSSRSSSPGRSVIYESAKGYLVDEHNSAFIVNIKPERKSKLSSVVLKIRGIDQETWRHHVTGGKLREITEEAKSFAIGNKALAALFVHTPAGELQRRIRVWLAENFEFLSVTSYDDAGGTTGQLELLSTAIMDGWMAGLGAAMPPSTDALGQLLSEYSKRVYDSQLQHLKDIAGTLATEEAEDMAQVSKLRSALESVDHKRRKILEQMRSDAPLFTLGADTSPVRNPSTAVEDARLASLISLDGILKQVKDITRQASVSSLGRSKKRALLELLDELAERMPSLLDIDHPCAQRHIADARQMVLFIPEEDDSVQVAPRAVEPSRLLGLAVESDVAQWNVLQFNTGSTSPFIIKCGANSNLELVIKAEARVQEPKGGEIMRVAPKPALLEKMSLDGMKQIFSQLPEALSLLALARTADGTRARYSRLYKTLAMKVPALKDLVGELEKGGVPKDLKS